MQKNQAVNFLYTLTIGLPFVNGLIFACFSFLFIKKIFTKKIDKK